MVKNKKTETVPTISPIKNLNTCSISVIAFEKLKLFLLRYKLTSNELKPADIKVIKKICL